MFEDALREAKALDEEFERTKQLRGPLHGLPISLKDESVYHSLVSPDFPLKIGQSRREGL